MVQPIRDERVKRPKVSLHDVDDVEAFVQATLNASGIQFPEDEREELVAEGLAIMVKLAKAYQPRRGDHQQDGRFSGYAAMYLPRRLSDAWHRLHPEHLYVTDTGTGKRRWEYLALPVSLDALANSSRRDTDARHGDGGYGDHHLAKANPIHAFRPVAIPSAAA